MVREFQYSSCTTFIMYERLTFQTTSPGVSFSYIAAFGGSSEFIWLRVARAVINKPSRLALYA